MRRVGKITISLPKEMVEFADKLANAKKISRSRAIASCLEEAARKQFEEELAEGYRVMAEEHKKMAELAFEAQRQVVPEWQ